MFVFQSVYHVMRHGLHKFTVSHAGRIKSENLVDSYSYRRIHSLPVLAVLGTGGIEGTEDWAAYLTSWRETNAVEKGGDDATLIAS